MKFGKNETFLLIEEALKDESGAAYDPVCKILYSDVRMLVNQSVKGIHKSDKDDIIQAVVFNVCRALPRFYYTSVNNNYSENEKNAYLKKTVKNEIYTFFRRRPELLSLNDAVNYSDERIDNTHILEYREELFGILKSVFGYKTTPEKLIAFIYNRIIGGLSGVNGKPKEISEEFCNRSILSLYNQMVSDLSEILQCPVPDEVLDPLRSKVNKCPDKKFVLSPRTITDSSNQYITKLKMEITGDVKNE